MNDLNEIREECLTSLNECADNVLKYLEGKQKDKYLNNLQLSVKKYCVLDYQTQVCEEALENVTQGIDVNTLSTVDDKFLSILKSLVSKRPNVDKHAAMVEFKNKLRVANTNLNESDIIETESSQIFIDPITKKRIVTPVRNSHCGHVYEKTSIAAMLKKKSLFKCPVMGCGNRQNIQMSDLIVDENLRIRLTQMADDDME